jgi:uncharacterized membrane protein (DUF4010 family)
MDLGQAAIKLVVSLIIGAVIGLERESHDNTPLKGRKTDPRGVIGIRTFSLLTTLGTVSGLMLKDFFPVFVLISVAFVAILTSYYLMHSFITKDAGFTTELGIIFSYLIGIIIAIGIFPIQFTLAFSVILVLILARKSDIQIFLRGLQREEVHAFISYALIALVILPFLPNENYSLSGMPTIMSLLKSFNLDLEAISKVEIINPFKLWFIVVAITGIDMLGHILERTIGTKKGRMLASIIGGFISSTATTISLAQESKSAKKNINSLIAAATLANVASFFPLLFLIFLINSSFLIDSVAIFLATIVSGTITALYFLKKKDQANYKKAEIRDIKGIKESEIFALIPALKFALLFLGVTLVTRIALEVFGDTGFLLSSSLAALTGVDAVTINIASLVGKSIDIKTGVFALILMNSVNLIGKTFYSFLQGKREFAIKFGIVATIMILSSFLGILFA